MSGSEKKYSSPKEKAEPKSQQERDKLKEEVAEELNLDDDVQKRGWENLTTRETGKIGGNVLKKIVRSAKKTMDKEDSKMNSDKKDEQE